MYPCPSAGGSHGSLLDGRLVYDLDLSLISDRILMVAHWWPVDDHHPSNEAGDNEAKTSMYVNSASRRPEVPPPRSR